VRRYVSLLSAALRTATYRIASQRNVFTRELNYELPPQRNAARRNALQRGTPLCAAPLCAAPLRAAARRLVTQRNVSPRRMNHEADLRDEAARLTGRRFRSNRGRCVLNHRWPAPSQRSHGRGGPKHGSVICRG
jgi:hypothetical protein